MTMIKSTRSPRVSGESPLQDREVTAYLRRLITSIAIGVVLMVIAAVWAWSRYGPKPGGANLDHPRPTWAR
jgi:hypothetical protein